MTIKVILKVNDETGQPAGAVQSVDFQRHGATVILLGCNYDSVPFTVTEEGFEIGGTPFRARGYVMYDGELPNNIEYSSWMMRDVEANRLLAHLQGTQEWWAQDGDELAITDFNRGASVDLVEERLMDES